MNSRTAVRRKTPSAPTGYEIHTGRTEVQGLPFCTQADGHPEGCVQGDVFGTYLHGVFDAPEAALRTAQALAQKKGVTLTGEALDTHAYKEQQYDKLADSVRKSLDMEWIYRIMEGKE